MERFYKNISKPIKDVLYIIHFIFKAVLFYSCGFSKDFVFKGYNTKRVHVLGNGPSLSKSLNIINTDLDDIIMVNYSPLSDIFWELKPKFLCLLDPVYFNKTEMSSDERNKKEMYKRLEEIDWNLTIVSPVIYRKKIVVFKNKNIKYDFVNYVSIGHDVSFFRFQLYKYNLSAPAMFNVVVMALYMSLQRGYHSIVLHGVDADLFKRICVNDKNEIIIDDAHFYAKEKRNLNKEKYHGYTIGGLYRLLEDQSVVFKSYVDLFNYSKYLGIKIFNATHTSMIDAFERFKSVDL